MISVLIGDGTVRHAATLRGETYGTLCRHAVNPERITSVYGEVTCKRCLAAAANHNTH